MHFLSQRPNLSSTERNKKQQTQLKMRTKELFKLFKEMKIQTENILKLTLNKRNTKIKLYFDAIYQTQKTAIYFIKKLTGHRYSHDFLGRSGILLQSNFVLISTITIGPTILLHGFTIDKTQPPNIIHVFLFYCL